MHLILGGRSGAIVVFTPAQNGSHSESERKKANRTNNNLRKTVLLEHHHPHYGHQGKLTRRVASAIVSRPSVQTPNPQKAASGMQPCIAVYRWRRTSGEFLARTILSGLLFALSAAISVRCVSLVCRNWRALVVVSSSGVGC
jgi:hypothetical protein